LNEVRGILLKLALFKIGDRKGVGVVIEESETIIDLQANYDKICSKVGKTLPKEVFSEMKKFIKYENEVMGAVKELFEEASLGKFSNGIHKLKDVKILPPIENPSKIICTGLNFEDYRKILGLEYLPIPQIFLKAPSAIIGHMDPIKIPLKYGEIYHEWELACIIKRKCKNVSEKDADNYIFGYTIFNDITAHDIELLTRELQQWAKSIDTFAPMGPVIATKDELKDVSNLRMIRRRNGVVECESNTSQMRFSFRDIIAFTSSFITLEVGDVITSGSPPAGPIYPGDIIEAEIEGIGVLTNPVLGIETREDYARKLGLIK
jgi:2-keto-4-pentenoate hydratase/2-oxohepta-3-ene-1,7-dioic acid hydratase in catechol pathway